MAHLHRLIRLRLLTLILLSAVSLPSFAESVPASISGYTYLNGSVFSDISAACKAYNSNSTGKYRETSPGADRYDCDYFVTNWLVNVVSTVYACSSGFDLSGRLCTRPDCPKGRERQPDGSCKPEENTCKYAVDEQIPGVYSMPSSFSGYGGVCLSGCRGYFVPYREGGASDGRLYGRVFSYGEPCTAGGNDVPSSAPNEDPRTKCIEKGMAYGESNGVIVCVPKGDSGGGNNNGGSGNTGGNTGNQGGTAGNQGGTAGNQGGGSGGNQGGSGSGSGNGTGGDGSGTGGTGNGSGSGEGSGSGIGGGGSGNNKKNEMEDFCAKHPDLPLCKKSSYSGSGCDKEPTCDGDVIQCAQARELWKMQCALTPTDKKIVDFGNKIVSGEDDISSPADKENLSEIDLPSVLNTSETYSGSCPPDLSISLMGKTVTYSFGNVCNTLHWIGHLGVALSLLTGAIIIVGAIRG